MKLSLATPEQKIEALAELDGIIIECPCHECLNQNGCNYFTSYDAIIPPIQKQSPEIQWLTFAQLASFVDANQPAYLGSASLYSDALLIATGKFEL